ncbi:hypothetical protein KAT36_00340 [Candidatus Pacearchaeota archaeon]|nr:hypothetical protein [Candidatus Pacearchaeota archaeon]
MANSTIELLNKEIPRKIYGLLLCEDMSETDLAILIYNNPNQRGTIHKWILELLNAKMIRQTHTNKITCNKKLYKADLFPLGNFDGEETRFINAVLERFIDKSHKDVVGSFKEMFEKILMTKEVFKKEGMIDRYSLESKDFKDYEKHKEMFWRDEDFRRVFLNNIKSKKPIRTIRKDFVFMSLIVPSSLTKSIHNCGLTNIDSPLYFTNLLLNNPNY